MTSLTIGMISAACICGGALVGFALQRVVPSYHLSKDAHDMVKLAVGVIATSTALVLGLLISSSKGQFDAMGEQFVQYGANIIILDNTLAEYGFTQLSHIASVRLPTPAASRIPTRAGNGPCP